MGGFFCVASKTNCTLDLFYGVDYHSHLGTRRGGMTVYGKDGFSRKIHNIENSPFRTKFERDAEQMKGNLGIASISLTLATFYCIIILDFYVLAIFFTLKW